MKNSILVSTFFQKYRVARYQALVLSSTLFLCVGLLAFTQAQSSVTLLKAPNGGIQPQAQMDEKGNLHLIYYSGDQGGGNLFYVIRQAGKEAFSAPIQVNSVLGSSVSAGTIRGGQMALGKGGRVHVAWNGSKSVKGNMEYARLNDAGTEFEAERGLMLDSMNLDGGGSIAADDKGNVYVVWHGNKAGGKMTEDQRQVWIAISKDDGKTFAKEILVWDKLGVCACCQMRAFADHKGTINILYRSAIGGNRDINLLFGKEGGLNFTGGVLHPWKVATCPMSTMGISDNSKMVVTAWETDGQIYFSTIKPGVATSNPVGMPIPKGVMASTKPKIRKFPCIAVNTKGEIIVAWAEGAGWAKGGDLVWQVFANKGNPTEDKGRLADGVPVWGLPSVVAMETGFLLIH